MNKKHVSFVSKKEHRKHSGFLIAFFTIAFLIALLIYIHYEGLQENIEELVELYGYPVVFILSFLVDVLEQPFGPEIPGSFAIALGLNAHLIFLIVVAGNLLGVTFSYFVGKWILAGKIQTLGKTEKYSRYWDQFLKYGKYGLLVATLSPVPFVFFCWLSGAFTMKMSDFYIYGFGPRIVRIGVILYFAHGIFT